MNNSRVNKGKKKVNPSYYAVIPAEVRYDKTLPDKAKLLYGEITALCNKEGYCWATNQYFAELYSVHKRTISRLISSLNNAKHITMELIYKEDDKTIDKRKIYVNTLYKKTSIPIDNNVHSPIDNKVKDNTTTKNTTFNNQNAKTNHFGGNKLNREGY